MRFADLLRLSLSALWQQKLRTFLTTLGVVFGAFVLVFSLSLGQGVQTTIDRESHRHVFLRRIDVHPQWQANDDSAAEEVQIKGDMNEEKRQRLRQALLQQKLAYSQRGPRVPLTQERLQEMRSLEHVEAVTPVVQQSGWVIFDKQTQAVGTCSADPDNAYHRQRIVAGNFFQAADERSVVLSEFLCYLLGVTDDEDVQRLIGRKIRLEFRSEPLQTGLHVYLMKSDGTPATRQESLALEKIRQQLPGTLDQLGLSEENKTALRGVLQRQPRSALEVIQEELTICGVVRLPGKEEQNMPWDRLNQDADVLLPSRTAEALFFRQKEPSKQGVNGASILVDREENVRPVLGQITAMNLDGYAPLEFIERERLLYLLIFTTMTCVAAVALLVAALGIANTMLMSVLERTREIGIFKAVGAGDATVQLVFLIEGAFIGLIGGGAGLLLAWAGSFPADSWIRAMVSRDLKIDLKESLFVFPWWLSLSVVLFAMIVTTLAAVFPARRAARVNPVTALRNE